MKERFKVPNAVFLMLLRNSKKGLEILLQKRQNTGYKDGFWDVSASGHVESGEAVSSAILREAYEEIGVKISKANLGFGGFYYNNIENKIYGYTYFYTYTYQNTPKINEPKKCSNLEWFEVLNLPEDIIADRKIAICNFLNDVYFGEIGW